MRAFISQPKQIRSYNASIIDNDREQIHLQYKLQREDEEEVSRE